VLGGADAIVFGGGIGEHSAVIRSRICERMDWCGLRIDPVRNEAALALTPGTAIKISEDRASLACYVAGVDEEVEIARATRDCFLKSAKGASRPSTNAKTS
jgi:acetate kinase